MCGKFSVGKIWRHESLVDGKFSGFISRIFSGRLLGIQKIGNGFLPKCHFSRNLAYNIYKEGIFPKLVAGKCPTIFNKVQFGRNFSWWLS